MHPATQAILPDYYLFPTWTSSPTGADSPRTRFVLDFYRTTDLRTLVRSAELCSSLGRLNNPRSALIPSQEIRIVNPRSRNRIKFQSVMTSIGTGLASRNLITAVTTGTRR